MPTAKGVIKIQTRVPPHCKVRASDLTLRAGAHFETAISNNKKDSSDDNNDKNTGKVGWRHYVQRISSETSITVNFEYR